MVEQALGFADDCNWRGKTISYNPRIVNAAKRARTVEPQVLRPLPTYAVFENAIVFLRLEVLRIVIDFSAASQGIWDGWIVVSVSGDGDGAGTPYMSFHSYRQLIDKHGMSESQVYQQLFPSCALIDPRLSRARRMESRRVVRVRKE